MNEGEYLPTALDTVLNDPNKELRIYFEGDATNELSEYALKIIKDTDYSAMKDVSLAATMKNIF